ncbi:MAG: hypothetical protein JJ863_09780 [Deltaproteobacteria bacterium]|nr:hypothetical protein [Deltaproteobacteria bacterium]
MIQRSLLALLLAGCASQTPAEEPSSPVDTGDSVAADGYVIQLDRRHRVGERARWEQRVENLETQRMLVGGEVAREDASMTHGELVATVEVQEVDANGRVLRAEFTIERLRADRNGEVAELPAGSVVTVTRSDQPDGGSFALGGAPVDEPTEQLLALFVSKRLGGDVDGVFGSTTPRQVGEAWPMDVDRFLADFAGRGVPVELARDTVEGAGELVAVEDLDGTEVLHLVLASTARIASIQNMPGEVTSGELTMTMDGQWPSDGVSPQRTRTTTMVMQVEAAGEDPQAGPFTMQIGFGNTEQRTVTPL